MNTANRYATGAATPGRLTRNRAALLGLLGECTEFRSAQELRDLATATGRRISLTTVYRALHYLELAEQVDIIRDEKGERLYRRRQGDEHRHYLICRRCARSVVVDADPVERWAARLGRATGFSEVEHIVELTGVCQQCPSEDTS